MRWKFSFQSKQAYNLNNINKRWSLFYGPTSWLSLIIHALRTYFREYMARSFLITVWEYVLPLFHLKSSKKHT